MAGGEEAVRVVFLWMETTGFDPPVRPLQISAIDSWGKRKFNQFVLPDRDIHPRAAEKNKFYIEGDTLYREKEGAKRTRDIKAALINFVLWLNKLGGPVILVSHNCFAFQAKILLENFKEFGVRYDQSLIRGFSDSLAASRKLYLEMKGYSLPQVKEVVGVPKGYTHDALRKANDCRRVVKTMAAVRRINFVRFVTDARWYRCFDDQAQASAQDRVSSSPQQNRGHQDQGGEEQRGRNTNRRRQEPRVPQPQGTRQPRVPQPTGARQPPVSQPQGAPQPKGGVQPKVPQPKGGLQQPARQQHYPTHTEYITSIFSARPAY